MSEAPDFAEPFEAWRVWRVVRTVGELSLVSVVHSTLWPAGRALTAECLRSPRLWTCFRHGGPHSAPDPLCECGIYATTLDRVGDYLGAEAPARRRGTRVLGRVSLWGDVVECERGLRASHAYPARIYVPADVAGSSDLDVEEITLGLARYLVPVEPLAYPSSGATDALAERHAA